jgi:hypothetical protein
MLGIPSVLGAGFVYNLKHDDDFYEHFNEKYPDLIEWIDQYYPLNEDFAELANRTDIGPIASPSEIQQESKYNVYY